MFYIQRDRDSEHVLLFSLQTYIRAYIIVILYYYTCSDTEKLYSQAIQTVLHRFNKIYDWEMNVSLMGMHHMDVCTRIVENYDLPLTPEEYSKLQRAENEKILCKAEFKPGKYSERV